MRHAGATATTVTAVVSGAASAGWISAVVLIVSVLALLAVACWIISDPDRAQRLTHLIQAWKNQQPTP